MISASKCDFQTMLYSFNCSNSSTASFNLSDVSCVVINSEMLQKFHESSVLFRLTQLPPLDWQQWHHGQRQPWLERVKKGRDCTELREEGHGDDGWGVWGWGWVNGLCHLRLHRLCAAVPTSGRHHERREVQARDRRYAGRERGPVWEMTWL